MTQTNRHSDRFNFVEPTSYEEALRRREVLIEEMLAIDFQLAQNPYDRPVESKMTQGEYIGWRKSAKLVKLVKQAEITNLKRWMKLASCALRQEQQEENRRIKEEKIRSQNTQVGITNLDDPTQLIAAANQVFQALIDRNVPMTKDERTVIGALRRHSG